MYNFDEVIDRRASDSLKWATGAVFFKEDAIPMWVADMDFRAPQPVVDALVDRARHGVFGYPIRTEAYCQAIINWFNRRHAWQIEKDWIIPNPGVVTALTVAVLSCTQPGDVVIVQPPVYFPFFSVTKNSGRQLAENCLKVEDGVYRMDFDDLEVKMKDPRARMLVMCSPHNPVGRVWTGDELRRAAELCLKYHIVLVSDEIHCDLVFAGHQHTMAASLSAEIAQNTITLVAPSKTFNLAGLNSSAAIIPNPELRKRYAISTEFTHVGGSSVFGLLGLEAAYNQGEEWLDELLVYLNGNLDVLEAFFKERIPRIKVYRPQGTYLVWLDCTNLGLAGHNLRNFMLQQAGLALNDGATFGCGGEGFMRMNVACPRSILQQALLQLEAAVNKL